MKDALNFKTWVTVIKHFVCFQSWGLLWSQSDCTFNTCTFQSLYLGPVMKWGTQNQIEEFAKPFMNSGAVGCFALSEPGEMNKLL